MRKQYNTFQKKSRQDADTDGAARASGSAILTECHVSQRVLHTCAFWNKNDEQQWLERRGRSFACISLPKLQAPNFPRQCRTSRCLGLADTLMIQIVWCLVGLHGFSLAQIFLESFFYFTGTDTDLDRFLPWIWHFVAGIIHCPKPFCPWSLEHTWTSYIPTPQDQAPLGTWMKHDEATS